MKKAKKYQQIQQYFKKRIQVGEYVVNSYLPSENEICAQFTTTRGTVRKALDELMREGYIEKEHGRGSRVVERRKSLGLLTVKGFSGATDYEVQTKITQPPKVSDWDPSICFPLTDEEKNTNAYIFKESGTLMENPLWWKIIGIPQRL